MFKGIERLNGEDFAALMNRVRRDPIFFVTQILGGSSPWQKQREVLEAVRDHRAVVVRSGHGVGKTWTAARAALWFLYSFPPARVVTLAPTWRQVETVLWGEIRRAFRSAKLPLIGKLRTTRLDITDGWGAAGLSTDEPERLQGLHSPNMLAVLDEAPGISPVLHEATEGILTSANSRLLLIGNPVSASGPFYEAFRSERFHKVALSCLDHPNVIAGRELYPGAVTREWVAERERDWGEDSPAYISRVLGQFPVEKEDSLFRLEWIERAMRSTVRAGTHKRLGVDVARFGKDSSVIALACGGRLVKLRVLCGKPITETCGEVLRTIREEGVEAREVRIDDTGLGGGLTDRLRELGCDVTAVNFGSRALKHDRFANRSSEMFWHLRELLESSSIALPDDNDLLGELINVKYQLTSDGRIRVDKRGGRRASPDRADAVALAFAQIDEEPPGVHVIEAHARG